MSALVIRVITISFMAESFVSYEKVLVKWCYIMKDLSYF